MSKLREKVGEELFPTLPDAVGNFARQLGEPAGAVAVLFYGSVLRTENLDDLLDFYVLTGPEVRQPRIWPEITFPEMRVGERLVRAKVATMPLSLFADAAAGRRLDTTIWTRFCQPCALAWARDLAAADEVADAVAAAIVTAARYAAVLGPETATPEEFWTALFDRTYETEFRVEAPGRSAAIVAHVPERYAQLLPLAWEAAGIAFSRDVARLHPDVPADQRRSILASWRKRAKAGKPLNLLRLAKAGLTLRNAGSYALWKIERHTGVYIEATPWRRHHPLLAAPGVLWQLSRARRSTVKP